MTSAPRTKISSSSLRQASSASPVTVRAGRARSDPDLMGDLGGRDAVVAGDDVDANPGAVRTGDGLCDLGARRVVQGHDAEQAQVTFHAVPVVGAAGKVAVGNSEEAEPTAGVAVEDAGISERSWSVRARSDPTSVASRQHFANTASGAPFELTQTPPVVESASTVVIMRRRGSNRNVVRRAPRRSAGSTATPTAAANCISAISVGSPRVPWR